VHAFQFHTVLHVTYDTYVMEATSYKVEEGAQPKNYSDGPPLHKNVFDVIGG